MEPTSGFEPLTCCLQNSCSGQLSYVGTPKPTHKPHFAKYGKSFGLKLWLLLSIFAKTCTACFYKIVHKRIKSLTKQGSNNNYSDFSSGRAARQNVFHFVGVDEKPRRGVSFLARGQITTRRGRKIFLSLPELKLRLLSFLRTVTASSIMPRDS